MRVHTYVIATDAGSAPNYGPPAVTLAVCKPGIRKKAKVSDLVLAFAGARVNPSRHSVVWAGIVSEVLTFTEYWEDSRFTPKKSGYTDVPDNFYKPTSNHGLAWQPNPVHGPEAQVRDTRGMNVLVFDQAWRFGAFGPLLPEDFGLRMVGSRRGDRAADLSSSEWLRVETWLSAQVQVTVDGASGRNSSRSCRPCKLPVSSQPVTPLRRGC